MNDVTRAQQLMAEFGERTGLAPGSGVEPRRYLWTDAFAVCNYLALHQLTGLGEYLARAILLAEQVHEVLGRHRAEDRRKGRLSGLDDLEGRLHPTAGGLRIGKKLPERGAGEPADENLEWERDGQYYHYLTKWMHALCLLGMAAEDAKYIHWAAELAERSHAAFSYTAADGSKRLYWKMSIDLSRPLVCSMGHHDPLDGLITSVEIAVLRDRLRIRDCPDLARQQSDLAEMCRGVNWATSDPLGLGTLLADIRRLQQLQAFSGEVSLPGLLPDMLNAAILGLSFYAQDNSLHLPAAYRLAFRELGLAIGLQAVPGIVASVRRHPGCLGSGSGPASLLEKLKKYQPLRVQILHFWLKRENREVFSWTEHADINMVMLATCLVPGGFLDLHSNHPISGNRPLREK